MNWKLYIRVIINVNQVPIFLLTRPPNNLAFKIASAVLSLVDTKIMQYLIGILLLSPSPYLLDICSFWDKSGYLEAVGKVSQTNLFHPGGERIHFRKLEYKYFRKYLILSCFFWPPRTPLVVSPTLSVTAFNKEIQTYFGIYLSETWILLNEIEFILHAHWVGLTYLCGYERSRGNWS